MRIVEGGLAEADSGGCRSREYDVLSGLAALVESTRKQISETDYLASSVVARLRLVTCGIASEEDTGRRFMS